MKFGNIILLLGVSVFLISCEAPTPNTHIKWTKGVTFSCPVNFIPYQYVGTNIMTCRQSSSTGEQSLPNPMPTDWVEAQPGSIVIWKEGMLFMCPNGTSMVTNTPNNSMTCGLRS
jgi:hypothetical protein